jgi:hypothetical protein
MLRLVELVLFFAPFAVFLAWRFAATERGPSTGVLLGFGCALLMVVAALIWLSQDRALPPGADYAPARLVNGHVVSGHAEQP